jgi:predicted ATP-binding protein involved in virulence
MIFYVDRLKIRDFKGLGTLDFSFADHRPVVFIGENGSGKSSLLAAVNLALGHFTSRVRNPKSTGPLLDIRHVRNGARFAEVHVGIKTDSRDYDWKIVQFKAKSPIWQASQFGELREITKQYLQEDANQPVPLIAFYPTNRAVQEVPLRALHKYRYHPVDAYETTSTGIGLNFRLFFEWFRFREDLENEVMRDIPNAQDAQLEAVRAAIAVFDPAYSALRVRRNPLRLVVNRQDPTQSREISFDQLSDGEKCVVALIGDIARRLAIANPHSFSPLASSGVVLIDEIELHLHPSWQRRIVPILTRVFPNCQFFLSTHSPQVLSEIETAYVFVMKADDNGAVAAPVSRWYGKDSNRILEDLMGVSERPNVVKEELRLLFRQIDEGNLAGARDSLAAISEKIGSDDPSFARASVLIKKKEVLRR